MRDRDIAFRKLHRGSMTDEGRIVVSPAGIISTESTSGTGDQMTTLTLQGGREIHVRDSHDEVRKAIAKARQPAHESAFERAFGGPAFRAFFGLGSR